MFKRRIGEAFTFGLTSCAVVAGIMVANSLVSTPATGQSSGNPHHTNPDHSNPDHSSPFHSSSPFHGPFHQHTPPPTPPTPITSLAFRCNGMRGFDLQSQWVTNGVNNIYDFFGDDVPSDFYGCTDAGFTINVPSGTSLSTITYELNNQTNCNDNIGPDVYINFNLSGGGTGTNRVVCSEPPGNSHFQGIDSSTGYAIYTLNASDFEATDGSGVDTAYEAGDTLNNVDLVFFPGQSSQGTVKVTNVTFNGQNIVPIFGFLGGCQNYIQTELQARGFTCRSSCD